MALMTLIRVKASSMFYLVSCLINTGASVNTKYR